MFINISRMESTKIQSGIHPTNYPEIKCQHLNVPDENNELVFKY